METSCIKALRRLGVPIEELLSSETEAVVALILGEKGLASQVVTVP